MKVLKTKQGLCDFNENRFQSYRSDTCGEFCLYFLVERVLNDDIEFEDLLKEIFTVNLKTNEDRVQKFIEENGRKKKY